MINKLILALLIISQSSFLAAEPATYTVETTTVDHWLELDGVVEAINSGTLSAQTSGRVVALHYDVNDYVEAGAVILEITSQSQSARLRAAKAQVDQARAQSREAQLQLQRYQALFPKGAISQGQLDNAIATADATGSAVLAAQAQLDEAKEALGYTLVRAPYAGVVTARYVELGETVSPGQPLYSGLSLDKMRAVIEVPQRYLKAITPHTLFKLTLPGAQELVSSDFTLFSYADAQTHSFKVRVNLPEVNNGALFAGMWIKTAFIVGQRESLFVPEESVIRRSELSGVYVQEGENYLLRQIRLGRLVDSRYEVLAGLRNGEVIAINAAQHLATMEAK